MDFYERPEQVEKLITDKIEEFWKKWRVNQNWYRQNVYDLKGDVDKKSEELLKKYWLWKTFMFRKEYGEKHKIKYPVAICIAKADTSLGKFMKSTNNIGNVWNNDRGDVKHYGELSHWIEAIFKTLNNRYVGNNNTIWELSQWGRANMGIAGCWEKNTYCYATSESSWNINVINCLNMLYDNEVDEYFEFRSQ